MNRHAARTAAVAPPRWSALPLPRAALDTVVVIPVRSEAERLPATLAALAAQVGLDGRPLRSDRFEVIVLANNCADDSADIVRRFAAAQPALVVHVVEIVLPDAEANVGHARGCLMDEACRRLHSLGRLDGIIASTDGDTRVAPDWLAATAQEMQLGADAVGGRIDMNDDTPLPPAAARLARRDADYQRLRDRLAHVLDPDPADPWPRHHQHFGASLAVTVDAYLRVGGLPARPFLEDEALWQALRAQDMKLRHSDRVRVVTSNRRRGRVAVGLSWQLREWSTLVSTDDEADAEVDDPARLAEELVLRRRLRQRWTARRAAADAHESAALADALRVPVRWLYDEMQSCRSFGQLWLAVIEQREQREQREAREPGAGGAVVHRIPMRRAIESLRSMLADCPEEAVEVSDVRTDRADSVPAATRSPA